MKDKVIIFDLDGTAVDSPKQKIPSNGLVAAIAKLKNSYYLCAATGRVWSFAKPLLKILQLTDPCIISGGTQICNPKSGEIFWQKTISEKQLQETLSLFKTNPQYKLLYNDGTEDDYFNGGEYPKNFKATEPVYFLEQVFVPDKIAQELYEKLKKIQGVVCVMVVSQKPGCRDLHIVNSEATKEQAVAELLKLLGVGRENTIGIGDGHNDVHLFNAVDYKVAMGNAADILKTMADKIIGPASEDGMAKYLETLA